MDKVRVKITVEDLEAVAPDLTEGDAAPDVRLRVLCEAVGPESGVDPSWYVDPGWPYRFPEAVLAWLPEEARAAVSFLKGHSGPARLDSGIALEAAKALWGWLLPMTCSSDLGQHLLGLDGQALAEVAYALGADLAGSVLAHVPERVAAAFCATLAPIWARRTWNARSRRPWKLNARQVQGLGEVLRQSNRQMALPRLGLVVLKSALASYPGDFRVLRQKLPRQMSEGLGGESILDQTAAEHAVRALVPVPPEASGRPASNHRETTRGEASSPADPEDNGPSGDRV